MPTKGSKTSAKKTGVKKSGGREKKPLVTAAHDQCFWMTDGRILSNLLELRDSLDSMADEVFKYHVTSDKNDFANWVEHVLDDAELASELRRSRRPATAKTVVVRRLKVYAV